MAPPVSGSGNGAAPSGATEWQDALASAVMALMGSVVEERLGRGRRIDAESLDIAEKARDRVALTDEARDDFMCQADLLARSTVDLQWASIEPLTRHGSPVFRGLADWPSNLAGQAPEPHASERQPGDPDDSLNRETAVHLVAHALAATALTGQATSVGFSGFSLPGFSDWARKCQSILAANIATFMVFGRMGNVDLCRYCDQAAEAMGYALGLEPDGRTVDELIAASDRAEELKQTGREIGWAAEDLTRRLLESGTLEADAERLCDQGRISIEPLDVAIALNPEWGDGAFGIDLDQPGELIREVAIAQAAVRR